MVAVCLLSVILAGYFAIIELIHDLVVNSTIPFNLQDISSLDISSIIGCFIISSVFLSFFLVGIRLFRSFFNLTGIRDIHNNKRKRITDTSLSRIVLYLIFFSVTATLVLNSFNNSIEKEKRKLLALKLGTSRDAMAELMFSRTEKQILGDSLFMKSFPTVPGKILKRSKTALNGTFKAYISQVLEQLYVAGNHLFGE